MKKFTTLFLAVLFVASLLTVSAFAVDWFKTEEHYHDSLSLFDFVPDTAAYFTDGVDSQGNGDAGDLYFKLSDALKYELVEDGNAMRYYVEGLKSGSYEAYVIYDLQTSFEMIRLEYDDNAAAEAGMGELFSRVNSYYYTHQVNDPEYPTFVIGKRDTTKAKDDTTAETFYDTYIKLRLKNNSTATQLSVGFFGTGMGSSFAFLPYSLADLPIDTLTDEWTTYTYELRDRNVKTNYLDGLASGTTGTLQSRWGGTLYRLMIAPFGYSNQTSGNGPYNGASLTLDYLVIGSEDYVNAYKSTLEEQEENVKDITILSLPTKQSYYADEILDTDGFSMEVTYKDGTKITKNSANFKYDFSEGDGKVKVKFGGVEKEFTVNVTKISSVEIETLPKLLSYDRDAENKTNINTEGLELKVVYADGTSKVINNGYTLSYDLSNFGPITVTVYYNGLSTTYDAEVASIASIEIETLPEKVDGYHVGETVVWKDKTFKINKVYTNEEKAAIETDDENLTASGELKTVGANTITMTYHDPDMNQDFTATFEVNVLPITELKITKNATKLSYVEEEKFSNDGIQLTVVYSDGFEQVVSDLTDVVFDVDLTTVGKHTVTVKYLGLETTYEVEVTSAGGNATSGKNTQSSATNKPVSGDTKSSSWIIFVIIGVVVVAAVVVVVIIISKKKK